MFKLLEGTSKGFVKALKALIFNLLQLSEMHETGRFNLKVMEGSPNMFLNNSCLIALRRARIWSYFGPYCSTPYLYVFSLRAGKWGPE